MAVREWRVGPMGSALMHSNRLRVPALVLALSFVLVACGGGGSTTNSGGNSAGEPTASGPPGSVTVDQLGGGELSLASLDGQDTVLWFWAPWCTVCRGEADDVVAAAAALEGKVQVIGVAGRGEVPEMEEFVEDTDTGGLTHIVDDDGAIWSSYGVFAQPAFAFLDANGDVEVFVGALGEKALVEQMNALAEA